MSITISLSPEEEKRLPGAARAGQDVAAYVRQLIHREIHGVGQRARPISTRSRQEWHLR